MYHFPVCLPGTGPDPTLDSVAAELSPRQSIRFSPKAATTRKRKDGKMNGIIFPLIQNFID